MAKKGGRIKRRRYDSAFKSKMIELHNQGRSIKSLSASFGISENVLYRWRKEYESASQDVGRNTQIEELRDLRKRLREVEQERDILKKALRIFSRHP